MTLKKAQHLGLDFFVWKLPTAPGVGKTANENGGGFHSPPVDQVEGRFIYIFFCECLCLFRFFFWGGLLNGELGKTVCLFFVNL